MAGLAIPAPRPRAVLTPWVPTPAPRTVDGTSLLIGGRETTDTDLRAGSLRCELLLDARGKLSCQLVDPPVPPAMDMDVLFTLAGVPFFGGIVVELTQTDADAWSIVASDNRVILDGLLINAVSPAGSLKSVLQWFVSIALGAYWFTVDDAMAAGPDVPALAWPFQSHMSAITQLGVLTGWSSAVSPTRVIRMYPGGTVPAPWVIDIDATESLSLRQSREGHATHVWVRFGSGPPSDITWATVGNGVAVTFTPPYSVATPANVVTVNGTPLPVLPYPDPGWSWETTSGGGILHAPTGAPPAAGTTIVITFTAAWPSISAVAEVAAPIHVGLVVDYPDIFDAATAYDLAVGELARREGYPRTFHLRTAKVGLLPGQSAAIDLPSLGLDTEALVTGVRLVHASTLRAGEIWWALAVDLIEANARRANWLTYWQQTKGGGAASGTGSSVTGTIPPVPPPTGGGGSAYAVWPLGGDHDNGYNSTVYVAVPNAVAVTIPTGFTGRTWTVRASVKRLLGTGSITLGLLPSGGTVPIASVSAPLTAAFAEVAFPVTPTLGGTYYLAGQVSDAATLFGATGYLEAVQP